MKYLVLIVMTVSLYGCGAIKVRDKNEAEVKQIKKVAIVSFSLYQPVSPMKGVGEMKEHISGGIKKDSLYGRYPSHATKMYNELTNSLKQNLDWRVMNISAMKRSSAYKRAFETTMKGFQNKFLPNKGSEHYMIKGVMDFDSARLLDDAGRDQLIEALGVDAIVVLKVNVDLNGTVVMGLGNRYPVASLVFQVYRKGSAKPVWFDGNIAGAVSDVSVGKTKFINHEKTSKEALRSAITAFKKIGKVM